jgi:hypothetical protein
MLRPVLALVSIVFLQLQFDSCDAQPGGAALAPPAGISSGAYGLASLSLNGISVSYTIVATGLSGPITGVHFHSSATTEVIFGICTGAAVCGNGNYFNGSWPNASAYLAHLKSGAVYINIHTEGNPSGEISGNVTLPFGSGPPYMAMTVLSSSWSMTGFGVAMLTLTASGGNLSYTVVATGLTGPFNRAHFHNGAAGISGGVINTICDNRDSWPACPSNYMVTGTWVNTSAYASALALGGVYINLHTVANASGEVRGQVMVGPTPPSSGAPSAGSPVAAGSPAASTTAAARSNSSSTVAGDNSSTTVVATSFQASAEAGKESFKFEKRFPDEQSLRRESEGPARTSRRIPSLLIKNDITT